MFRTSYRDATDDRDRRTREDDDRRFGHRFRDQDDRRFRDQDDRRFRDDDRSSNVDRRYTRESDDSMSGSERDWGYVGYRDRSDQDLVRSMNYGGGYAANRDYNDRAFEPGYYSSRRDDANRQRHDDDRSRMPSRPAWANDQAHADQRHDARRSSQRSGVRFGDHYDGPGWIDPQSNDGWGRSEDRGRGEHWGRGPSGYTRNADRITEEVNEHLTWNDQVDATHIRVRAENGEVYLEGSVYSRGEKQLAEYLAEKVRGVHDVHNRLRVHQSKPDDRENTGTDWTQTSAENESPGSTRSLSQTRTSDDLPRTAMSPIDASPDPSAATAAEPQTRKSRTGG